MIFLLVTIAYAGVWLALAMLFSVIFRSAATAALVTLGLWLFLSVIWPALAPAIAEALVSPEHQATLVITAPDAGAAVALDAVRRDRAGAARSHDPHAWAGLSRANSKAR